MLTRSLLIWLLLRAWVAAGSAAAGSPSGVASRLLLLTPRAVLLLLVLVGGAAWVWMRRRNEDLFFRCLGYGRLQLFGMLVAPAAVLEVIITIVART